MKKLLSIWLIISTLGAQTLVGDVVRKIDREQQVLQQIKVTNNTNKTLYVAVYVVKDALWAKEDQQEANIFSNIYSIAPGKYEIMDRPVRVLGFNRNLYFSDKNNLTLQLTPSNPIRANKLEAGEGVLGKQKEFVITQSMLKN